MLLLLTGLLCHKSNWRSQQLGEGAVTAVCKMADFCTTPKGVTLSLLKTTWKIKSTSASSNTRFTHVQLFKVRMCCVSWQLTVSIETKVGTFAHQEQVGGDCTCTVQCYTCYWNIGSINNAEGCLWASRFILQLIRFYFSMLLCFSDSGATSAMRQMK